MSERDNIRFTATDDLKVYRGVYAFNDGDVKNIPSSEANRLIADFPKNFSVYVPDPRPVIVDDIGGLDDEEEAVAPVDEKALPPQKNKAITKGRNK